MSSERVRKIRGSRCIERLENSAMPRKRQPTPRILPRQRPKNKKTKQKKNSHQTSKPHESRSGAICVELLSGAFLRVASSVALASYFASFLFVLVKASGSRGRVTEKSGSSYVQIHIDWVRVLDESGAFLRHARDRSTTNRHTDSNGGGVSGFCAGVE